MHNLPFTLDAISDAYQCGALPGDVLAEVFRRLTAVDDPGIFISLAPLEQLQEEARQLGPYNPNKPLWGMPFAVKDNIDVAGLPTTAACPAWSYTPDDDAYVVERLRAAGAIPIGKTNLDQFATGLVGVRTPYPIPRNALDPELIPGGSSSGSAVCVAHGIVPFALGTDTAGSGRVPAALNNIVGLKPSLGLLSSRGVVPACRTLDTVSVLALTVDDTFKVLSACAGHDEADPWSRDRPVYRPSALAPAFRVGVPDSSSIEFCGDKAQALAFERDLEALGKRGAEIIQMDFEPLYRVARLLYEGTWVAERHSVVAELLSNAPDTIHPTTQTVINGALKFSATDVFNDIYRLREYTSAIQQSLKIVDMLVVPSIPTTFTQKELEADPFRPNSLLGTYTNFVNLLDMCGLTVPRPALEDGRPSSLTLLTTGGKDHQLIDLGVELERADQRYLGATQWPIPERRSMPFSPIAGDELGLAVCGAHMSGLPLNHELTKLGARLIEKTSTAPEYKLFELPGKPARPGMVRAAHDGVRIPLEVWALPRKNVGEFLNGIPQPLGLGTVTLTDGSTVHGFLCESVATLNAKDITHEGGWRAWVNNPMSS